MILSTTEYLHFSKLDLRTLELPYSLRHIKKGSDVLVLGYNADSNIVVTPDTVKNVSGKTENQSLYTETHVFYLNTGLLQHALPTSRKVSYNRYLNPVSNMRLLDPYTRLSDITDAINEYKLAKLIGLESDGV